MSQKKLLQFAVEATDKLKLHQEKELVRRNELKERADKLLGEVKTWRTHRNAV